MKLFLSYPSAQRPLAERLMLALEGEGHDVFMDRTDLKAGEAFHQRLREAIEGAQAMIFLVTPESVGAGSYALTELGLAQRQWRHPAGRVLPVMVAATPIAALPAYLSAVTVLAPRGELVAEVVAAVAELAAAGPGRRRRWIVGAAVAAGVVAIAGVALWWQAGQREAERALQARERTEAEAHATSARQLCFDGSHEVAFAQLGRLAETAGAPATVRVAREDCAMRWLREMRATIGQRTFAEQVALVQPVLSQALAQASGPRAADLRSHIGWGEYLRGRDGAASNDPVPHWHRALEDDPANPYAHAMWARRLLDAPVDLARARQHFDQAVATRRDLGFVRALQLGGSIGGNPDLILYAVTVADQMRRAGETIEPVPRHRLWSYAFGTRMLDGETRERLYAALAPSDLLATFEWLFPPAELRNDQRALWRFGQASLLARNGQASQARSALEALIGELRAARSSGPLLDQAQLALDRLATPRR